MLSPTLPEAIDLTLFLKHFVHIRALLNSSNRSEDVLQISHIPNIGVGMMAV
jgi:hypothetical protein